ncbi:MAG: paraquat-inducible protein A [Saprospiraceae bacterium]|nr:paraquat-inducible protein A [Saprospiraceae bacterium]
MKWFISVVIAVLLGIGCYKAKDLLKVNEQLQIEKEDLAEITKLNYGLFNMQEWKKKTLGLFEDKLKDFKISSTAYKDVQVELEKYLNGIYKEYIESGKIFDQIFADAEKNGKINKFLLKLFKENISEQIGLLEIKGHIPQMAAQMAQELKKNEPRIKDIIREEMGSFLKDTDKYSYVDPRISIYEKYGFTELDSTLVKLRTDIPILHKNVQDLGFWSYLYIVLACLIAFFCYKILGNKLMVTFVTLCSIALLILGVTQPMINIDARLNAFVFSLFGRDIGFDEQSLFYQSKSILDVTHTLIESHGWDLKTVGVMILCFSVIFPAIKLVLSGSFVYSEKIANSRLVRNIIFYLGKWSMADVFVVALFMAYIGFEGIVANQLRGIERNEGGFAIETANYSGLAIGALFFTTYCILSIVLGIIINRQHKKNNTV